MIESRYKIEYVLPNEDVKKTSPFRVLWYLLLIPLVLLLVTAITYDFSLKEMSRDSLVLIEKVKIHILNLGDSPKPAKPAPVVVKKIITPEQSTATKIIENKAKKLVVPSTVETTPKVVVNKNKIIISELTAKQELQLKTIKSQIAKNTELSQTLNQISEKLVLEQVKTQQLNTRLAEQEKDSFELEEQLNKLLIVSDDKALDLEDVIIQENKEKTVAIETSITESTDSVEIKPVETVQEKIQVIAQDTVKEEKIEKSETDKIIEAMANIASDKKENIEAEVEPEMAPKIDLQTKNKEVDIVKNVKETSVQAQTTLKEDIVENKEPPTKTEPTLATQEIEVITTIEDNTKEENIEVKTEVTDIISKKEAEEKLEKKTKNTQAANNNSSVDDIVAAMQASQSNSTINVSQKSTENIDTELEKDIKKQLVEKGELSIDN